LLVKILWVVLTSVIGSLLNTAFVAQVPAGPARGVLDVLPLMMNRQDVFMSGETWAHLKFKFPDLSFDRFWWARVKKYDLKNQASLCFWKDTDLTERQSMRVLFGSSSADPRDDDVDEEAVVSFVLGSGDGIVNREGELVVPKLDAAEITERDRRVVYRKRVLEGPLPLVLAPPLLWGPLCLVNEGVEVEDMVADAEDEGSSEGTGDKVLPLVPYVSGEGRGSFGSSEVVITDVAEFVEEVAGIL
jgi:hypothetical protein